MAHAPLLRQIQLEPGRRIPRKDIGTETSLSDAPALDGACPRQINVSAESRSDATGDTSRNVRRGCVRGRGAAESCLVKPR